MAMTNADRQRKWLKTNRAAFNLKRRNARKKLGIGIDAYNSDQGRCEPKNKAPSISTAQITTKKVGELRMIVMPKETVISATPKPLIFRDDYGRIISEAQWNRLQERKEKARSDGYVIDDYSQ